MQTRDQIFVAGYGFLYFYIVKNISKNTNGKYRFCTPTTSLTILLSSSTSPSLIFCHVLQELKSSGLWGPPPNAYREPKELTITWRFGRPPSSIH